MLLVDEVNENDKVWMDFEMEETQLKLDTADMIMNSLCEEVATFLKGKL